MNPPIIIQVSTAPPPAKPISPQTPVLAKIGETQKPIAVPLTLTPTPIIDILNLPPELRPSRFIREGRFGPPKCGKTYSVVTSYPKPMLVLNFDEGGLDGIPTPIRWMAAEQVEAYQKVPQEKLPPICAIDFCDYQLKVIPETAANNIPIANNEPLLKATRAVNKLVRGPFPWKCIVVDSASGLRDMILAAIAKDNAASFSDAYSKWAGISGVKLAQFVTSIMSIHAHSVFIFHETQKDNEKTKVTSIKPLVDSQFRDRVGGLISQWFYACRENGKPKIKTVDYGLVTGLGCRWPKDLPATCEPDFQSIYGKEKLV